LQTRGGKKQEVEDQSAKKDWQETKHKRQKVVLRSAGKGETGKKISKVAKIEKIKRSQNCLIHLGYFAGCGF
jgi:hypothetical protein